MYTSFFGLGEKPFAITPDPRYLFMSERHAEALAHLLYGINEAGGFIQLTGEVGTGKTTVVRSLLERMPGNADVAVILNPQLSPLQFVLTICEELGIFLRDEDTMSIKDLVDVLNKRLLDAHARGRRVVVIVDEAQNLAPETLEQVRLLTNLETASQKLLQIILIGQPELRDVLSQVDLRQVAQRITGRYHLHPLSRGETAAYVNHRLKVAGAQGEIFTPAALREVHRVSRGVPRIINVVCDRALLGAFTQDQHRIGPSLVRAAASEVYGRSFTPPWLKLLAGAAASVAVIGLAIGLWQLMPLDAAGGDQLAEARALAAPVQQANAQATPTLETAESPAAIEIEQLLASAAAQTDEMSAFSELFALWGAELDARGGPPCEQALDQGLECFHQRGSWAQLRTLNRPAILTLIGEDGREHQLVVSKLGPETATIRLQDAEHEVSVASISRSWFGDYVVLWRPQAGAPRTLSAGMQGTGVLWLRQALDAVQGPEQSVAAGDYFDEELARRVEEFQRRHHLHVDGIAGRQTQIVLDMLTNAAGAPLLVADSSANRGTSS
ncbi:MAG TPA: AAA family ATPase [Steroidobacteraceae bacterium]